jgi:hypothetical protein
VYPASSSTSRRKDRMAGSSSMIKTEAMGHLSGHSQAPALYGHVSDC